MPIRQGYSNLFSCGVLQRPKFVTGSGPNPRRNPNFSRILMVGILSGFHPLGIGQLFGEASDSVRVTLQFSDHFTTLHNEADQSDVLTLGTKKMNIRRR